MSDRTARSGCEPRRVRGAAGLVVDRQFGSLFWGKLFSVAGLWAHTVIAAVVVYAATGSALWVGLVSIVQFAPQIVLTPMGGKWADRGHVPRQIIGGRLFSFFGSGGAAAYCYFKGELTGYFDVCVILVATLIIAFGTILGGPAMQSLVPLLIRPGELPTAMALNSLPLTLALAAGPAGGAYITANWGPALGFAIAAGTHLVLILGVLFARLPQGGSSARGTDFRVRTALVYVIKDRTMLALLIIVSAVGFGSEPSVTLGPTLAAQLGGSTELVGQLTGSFGLGALAGFVVYRLASMAVTQPVLTQGGFGLLVIGTAALAFAPNAVVAVAAIGFTGVGFMVSSTSAATLIQARVPDVLRGRVMALWIVGMVGSRPLASASVGLVTDLWSAQASLLIATGILVALFVVYRVLYVRGRARSDA